MLTTLSLSWNKTAWTASILPWAALNCPLSSLVKRGRITRFYSWMCLCGGLPPAVLRTLCAVSHMIRVTSCLLICTSLWHRNIALLKLFHRFDELTSSSQRCISGDERITKSLIRYRYPRWFIDDTRSRMKETWPREKITFKQRVVTIPLIKGLSESIQQALYLPKAKTVFKPCSKLGNLISKPKGPVPPESQSGAMYKIQCRGLESSCIGETDRKRSTRLKELQRDMRTSMCTTWSKTELCNRCCITGHSFDLDNAVTQAKEQR